MASLIESILNKRAEGAKSKIDASFDDIINRLNIRRKQLLSKIDVITKHKLESNTTQAYSSDPIEQSLQDALNEFNNTQNNLDLPNDIANVLEEALDEFKSYELDIDLDFNELHQIIDNIGEYEEPKYVEKIYHGLEGDDLLSYGYIRNIAQNAGYSQGIGDIQAVLFQFYSQIVHLNQHQKDIFNQEEKEYAILCNQFEKKLGDLVEDVFIDDIDKRESGFPLRVIDHSLNHNLKREATKVSLAINPSNKLMIKLLQREMDFPNDETVKRYILLLFDLCLIAANLPLPDPRSAHDRVCRLIQVGLDVFSDWSSTGDDYPTEFPDS